MNCLTDSIGHPWDFSIAICHIPNDLWDPNGSDEEENTFIGKVKLLYKSAHHQGYKIDSELGARDILLLSKGLHVVVHCLYL
jgi:hypothetical protein